MFYLRQYSYPTGNNNTRLLNYRNIYLACGFLHRLNACNLKENVVTFERAGQAKIPSVSHEWSTN